MAPTTHAALWTQLLAADPANGNLQATVLAAAETEAADHREALLLDLARNPSATRETVERIAREPKAIVRAAAWSSPRWTAAQVAHMVTVEKVAGVREAALAHPDLPEKAYRRAAPLPLTRRTTLAVLTHAAHLPDSLVDAALDRIAGATTPTKTWGTAAEMATAADAIRAHASRVLDRTDLPLWMGVIAASSPTATPAQIERYFTDRASRQQEALSTDSAFRFPSSPGNHVLAVLERGDSTRATVEAIATVFDAVEGYATRRAVTEALRSREESIIASVRNVSHTPVLLRRWQALTDADQTFGVLVTFLSRPGCTSELLEKIIDSPGARRHGLDTITAAADAVVAETAWPPRWMGDHPAAALAMLRSLDEGQLQRALVELHTSEVRDAVYVDLAENPQLYRSARLVSLLATIKVPCPSAEILERLPAAGLVAAASRTSPLAWPEAQVALARHLGHLSEHPGTAVGARLTLLTSLWHDETTPMGELVDAVVAAS